LAEISEEIGNGKIGDDHINNCN